MSKQDLFNRIQSCESEIARIRLDIQNMNYEIAKVNAKISENSTQEEYSRTYDMTIGETWKRRLCERAIELQTYVNNGFTNATNCYQRLNAQFSACITNANERIASLGGEIQACWNQIHAIEAAEAAERARRTAVTTSNKKK